MFICVEKLLKNEKILKINQIVLEIKFLQRYKEIITFWNNYLL